AAAPHADPVVEAGDRERVRELLLVGTGHGGAGTGVVDRPEDPAVFQRDRVVAGGRLAGEGDKAGGDGDTARQAAVVAVQHDAGTGPGIAARRTERQATGAGEVAVDLEGGLRRGDIDVALQGTEAEGAPVEDVTDVVAAADRRAGGRGDRDAAEVDLAIDGHDAVARGEHGGVGGVGDVVPGDVAGSIIRRPVGGNGVPGARTTLRSR